MKHDYRDDGDGDENVPNGEYEIYDWKLNKGNRMWKIFISQWN